MRQTRTVESEMEQNYTLRNSLENSFRLYADGVRNRVELELSQFVSRLSNLNLHPQIEYATLSQGKRLRPLLTILSAESVGGNRDRVMSLALAFEFLHTATLVHDDIIDHDEMRRGRPAVYSKWSMNDAILTGDACIAIAVDLASGYDESVMKIIAQSALELCDGEQIDVTSALGTSTEELYFKRIRDKSASLFRAAAHCGALAGGGTALRVNSLSMFGENLGIAYQLKDDLLDLRPKGNGWLKDLKQGRITLPLINSYLTSSPGEREEIETKLEDLMNQNWPFLQYYDTVEDLLRIIRRKGSFDYCQEKIDLYLRRAVESVSMLKDTEYKAYLVCMADELKTLG